MQKILFLQPGYAHYREKLFVALSQKHNIKFAYWSENNVYPGLISPGKFDYEFVDSVFGSKIIGLIRCFFNNSPDVIISSVSSSPYSILAFFYSRLARKKFILWIEEWQRPKTRSSLVKGLYRKFRGAVGRTIIRRCDALVASGTASFNYALSIGKNEREMFKTIQCSDDLAETRVKIRKEKSKGKSILYLSRIIDWKGLDLLLDAFSKLEKDAIDVSLIVAGDGPFRTFCEDLAEKLEIKKVQFLGNVEPTKTGEIYERADIFVLPSCNRSGKYEAWGLVINEAMSLGLPILTTTAVGAGYDMVDDDENGLVVADGSSVALYAGIKKLLASDLTRMSKHSREIFEARNNFQMMASTFSTAITSVCRN